MVQLIMLDYIIHQGTFTLIGPVKPLVTSIKINLSKSLNQEMFQRGNYINSLGILMLNKNT